MIDLHSHFLPGVDDGAVDLEASLAMLRIAAADGTRVIMATPHQLHPAGYHVEPDVARSRLAEVRRAVEAEGIDIELLLGAEVHFSEDIPEGLKCGSLLPISENGRHFLLELPVTTIPYNIKEVVFEYQTAGYFPILAHPERNFEIMSKPDVARDLRDRGIPLQLTAMSITGAFGRKSEKASRKLLRWGAADLIASDAHNPKRRPPGLRQAVEKAAKITDADYAEMLVTENPRRILEGSGLL